MEKGETTEAFNEEYSHSGSTIILKMVSILNSYSIHRNMANTIAESLLNLRKSDRRLSNPFTSEVKLGVLQ